MQVRLLGPIDAVVDGAALPVRGLRRKAVLAVLALHPGQVVSTGLLVEAVWGGAAPAAAVNAVHCHVSRLRQLTGSRAAIRTQAPGYLLDLGADGTDVQLAERLVRRGLQAEDHTDAARQMEAALALWRGRSLMDTPGLPWLDAQAERLDLLWLQASRALVGARLALGQHEQVLPALEALTRDRPFDELLHGQLMLALHRCGRQRDALAAYHRLRRSLAEDLGVDPGRQLRDLQAAILRQDPRLDPAPAPVSVPSAAPAAVPEAAPAKSVQATRAAIRPRQLPPAVRAFTGRGVELSALDALLAEADPAAAVISAVSGTAGVGKTALAVHWAHRVAARFPDGQLYVNLRGFDPDGQVLEAAVAVRGFLDALGVPPERVPASFEAQVGLYRSLLAGRRMLVVIDNARDAEHARPLLPGTGTPVAVVTSRSLLTELVAAEGAHPLAVDLLTEAESRRLLERRLGTGRVAAESDATRRIIAICARLPLALALVAARAATHPSFSLATAAAELVDATRHASLPDGAEDVIGRVRAVFSWSYTTLTSAAARLFRLLGLHPGPDTTAPAAASLAGLPHVRRLLGELTRAGLLAEQAPGRYGFHDLLAAYATHLTHTTDTAQEREAAAVRLLDHYTHSAHTAERHLNPTRDPIPIPLTPPTAGTTPERPTDQQAAREWLAAERPVLLAAQRLAADAGRDLHAWQLAWVLHTLLRQRGRWQESADAWRAAVPAAERLPHPAAATAHSLLGRAVTMLGDDEQAHIHLHHALHLDTEAGDAAGQAHTHNDLALLWERRGRPDRALDHAQQARTLYQAAGYRTGQAYALNAVGWYHALLGDHTRALTYCQQALTLLQQLGDREAQAAAWDSLGYAHHHLNQHAWAADCYQRALTLYGELGDRYYQADTLAHLGDTHHAAGHPDAAYVAWTTALDLLADLNHPDADAIRAKLAALDQTPPTQPGGSPLPLARPPDSGQGT